MEAVRSKENAKHTTLYPSLDETSNKNSNKVYQDAVVLIDLDEIDTNSDTKSNVKLNKNSKIDTNSTDTNKKPMIDNPNNSIIIHNPKLLANFQQLGEFEIFRKKYRAACEKGNLSLVASLVESHPDYDLSSLVNQSIFFNGSMFSDNKNTVTIASIMCTKSHFVSAKFIIRMIHKKINIYDYEKFFNELIDILSDRSIFDNSNLCNFTFDDFIDICKNIIKYETDVKQKLYRTILIMQYLHTNYIAGFNKSGYDFIESILKSEFCNNSSSKIIDGLKIRLITQIPKYQNDSKFSDLVTIQKEKYDKNELPILLAFITNGEYKGIRFDNVDVRNIVKELIKNRANNGNMCILYACQYIENDELPEVIKFLLDSGINVMSEHGKNTCLHYLMERLKFPKDPNITLKDEKVKETIKLLISRGLDPSHKNDDNKMASDYIDHETMQYLINF